MDSRTESFLLLGLLILVSAAVAHWASRRNLGQWLDAHPGSACFLFGLLWWVAFAGSALGFLLLALSPAIWWTMSRKSIPHAR
jgi:hypothetical protein